MTPDLPAYALEFLLPLCRDRFADAALGGFHERLDRAHNPLPMGGKRLMVQCRQLYVLSHAAALGERSGQNAAERGYAFLRRYQDRARGGWYFRATEAGEPLDPAKDLYGHAFLLFALAWLHRAFAAPDALALAAQTMDTLHARMASPHGGFWDNAAADFTPNPVPQRQNPHMHLLEAMLALHAASGDPRWLAEADALTRLFLARLFDPATGTLGEYFTADWTAHPDQGHIVEPGHHYEWVWLLRWFEPGDIDRVLATFRETWPDATPGDLFFAIETDLRMRQGAWQQAGRKAAQGGAPVWLYEVDWRTPVGGGKWKTPHSVELAFVFDNVAKSASMVGTGAEPQALADQMSASWLAFARSGNPDNPAVPHWPAYTDADRSTMVFDVTSRVVNDHRGLERKLLAGLSLKQTNL